MKNKKLIILSSILLVLIVIFTIGSSFSLFTLNITKDANNRVVIGNLKLDLTDSGNTFTDNEIVINSMEPMQESLALTKTGYNFTLTNNGTIDSYYTIYIDDVIKSVGVDRLDNKYVKVNLTNNTTNVSNTYSLNNITDRVLETGIINKNSSNSYTLRIWLDYDASNDAQNKYTAFKLRVEGIQSNALSNNHTYTNYNISNILADFTQEELTNNEVVLCSKIDGNNKKQYDCEVVDTLNNAIAKKDNSLIILTKDLNTTYIRNIDKIITLDLNNKTITFNKNGNYNMINVTSSTGDGRLTLKNGNISAPNLDTYAISDITGQLTIDNVTINATATNQLFWVRQKAKLEITNSNITSSDGGILSVYSSNTTEPGGYAYISNSIFNGGVQPLIVNPYDGKIVIDSGTFTSSNIAVKNSGTGTIDINGGTFTSTNSNALNNLGGTTNITGGTFISQSSTALHSVGGKLNINQTTSPIYIKSGGNGANLSGIYAPSTTNLEVNIKANAANACTANASDTTSGLCVYGSKNAVKLERKTTLSINGGTYYSLAYSDSYGIDNQGGTLNIKNATVKSNNPAITNGSYYSSSGYTSTTTIDGGSFESSTGYTISNGTGQEIKIINTTLKNDNSSYGIINSGGTMNICKLKSSGTNNKIANISGSGGHIYYSPGAFVEFTPTFAGATADIQEVNNLTCN